MSVLLSTAYFAPISHYRACTLHALVGMEQCENYVRQTLRNRCLIQGANGLIVLSVPIVHEATPKIKIRDVKVSYDTPWQRLHYKTLESAYRRSPFFEYYIDDLRPFFTNSYTYLYDLNQQIFERICQLLPLSCPLEPTLDFGKMASEDSFTDLRSTGKQSLPCPAMEKPYEQVFSEKLGFMPDLSILDLLFNLGPEAIDYLSDPSIPT